MTKYFFLVLTGLLWSLAAMSLFVPDVSNTQRIFMTVVYGLLGEGCRLIFQLLNRSSRVSNPGLHKAGDRLMWLISVAFGGGGLAIYGALQLGIIAH